MTNVSRAMLSLVVTLAVPLVVWAPPGAASAETASQKGAKTAPGAQATQGKNNPCGCYKDAAGSCFCGRKAHCGCPGECEPKGCAEKHSKDIEREIKAATRQAEELERKQKAASKSKSSGASASDTADADQKKKSKGTRETTQGSDTASEK